MSEEESKTCAAGPDASPSGPCGRAEGAGVPAGGEGGACGKRVAPCVPRARDGESAAGDDSSDLRDGPFALRRPRKAALAAGAAVVAIVVAAVVASAGYACGWFGVSDAQSAPADRPRASVSSDAEADPAGQGDGGSSDEQSGEGSSEEGDVSDADLSEAGDGSGEEASASSPAADASAKGGASGASSEDAIVSADVGSLPAPAPAPAPEPEPEPAPAPATITVSVYIDSSRATSYGWPSSLGGGTVTLNQGASVYDALVATGASVGGSSSYVRSIGGLAEFACGKGSGWLYFVNGVAPNYGCGSYLLQGGESITWMYTCDLGSDV